MKHSAFFSSVILLTLFFTRELKRRRRRRQRERQKSNRFYWQTNNFARASRFFVHFLAREMPSFTLCRGREQKTTTFLFFSWTLIQPLKFKSKKICQHLTNWTRWNKRDKVWSSANSLVHKWRFRSRRRRCCLSSLITTTQRLRFRKFLFPHLFSFHFPHG